MKTSSHETQSKQLHQAFPCISIETTDELMSRDLLHIEDNEWRLGDETNGTTRRFSNRKWKRADNLGEKWHKLIGLDDVVRNDRKYVLFVIEGSTDALAAAEIANRSAILPQTGIVCALGSGYRPIRVELKQLCGRWVGVIGDNDAAGIATTQIVSSTLRDLGVDHAIWNWSRCSTKEKDLFGWLASSGKPDLGSLCENFFTPLSPSYRSTLQPFNRSTTETAGIGADEQLGIVAPYIVRKRGTGNAMSFALARAIKHRKLDVQDINKIFQLWFAKSRALLPPDAEEDESLGTFYRQLKRVRFTEPALQAACHRASSAKPPFIPARDGDDALAKLAALCRELQRDARDRPFICPVNVAQQFLGLRWPSQANYLLHVLEEEKVIECFDRGAPNKPGQKGKPTLWLYKLSIDDTP
jgi:hypothetical protein